MPSPSARNVVALIHGTSPVVFDTLVTALTINLQVASGASHSTLVADNDLLERLDQARADVSRE